MKFAHLLNPEFPGKRKLSGRVARSHVGCSILLKHSIRKACKEGVKNREKKSGRNWVIKQLGKADKIEQ